MNAWRRRVALKLFWINYDEFTRADTSLRFRQHIRLPCFLYYLRLFFFFNETDQNLCKKLYLKNENGTRINAHISSKTHTNKPFIICI